MRSNRTVRKPTRWTSEEWREVEDAARADRVPALRYVREAALAVARARGGRAAPRAPATRARRRPADVLAGEIGRVLNNLRQLARLADDDDLYARRLLERAITIAEEAIPRVPARAEDAEPLVRDLVEAGRALNTLAHRANTAEELPPVVELSGTIMLPIAVLRRMAP